jgi:uncharacterized protein (DUF1810 family)
MDDFNLNRFVTAQDPVFNDVISELSSGRKSSHWMWFVFPQLKGLGMSHYSQFYGISSREEAVAYLNHELLGIRLRQVVSILLMSNATNPEVIFGRTDAMKLRSSLTLFSSVDSSEEQSFKKCLDKFFFGMPDEKTLALLSQQN